MPHAIAQWTQIAPNYQRGTILLGNGASMAVSPSFGYGSLLEHAQRSGLLADDVNRLFRFFGTSDFELILRLVWQASNVNKSLEIPDLRTHQAYLNVRECLIQAVRDVYEGKSALDSSITKKLMSNLFNKEEKKIVEPLTDRELDVLRLAAKGYTNKAIGMQLNISDRTVQGHLAHIFSKMQATSRTEAGMRAVSFGWISQGPDQLTEE